MGKTSTPTRILLTDSSLLVHPDLKPILDELIAQGHTVETNDTLSQYHFVAGPNCWYCVPEVAGLFDLALKQARKIASIEKKAMPKKEKPVKVPKVKKESKTGKKVKQVMEKFDALIGDLTA